MMLKLSSDTDSRNINVAAAAILNGTITVILKLNKSTPMENRLMKPLSENIIQEIKRKGHLSTNQSCTSVDVLLMDIRSILKDFGIDDMQQQLSDAKSVLYDYEQWEADLINDNRLWLPHADRDAISGKLYDDMIEIQAKRNKVLYDMKHIEAILAKITEPQPPKN